MSIPIIRSQVIGKGKPLVLLHAFPLSHQIWQNIQPPSGLCLVLPDFPGFGLSPSAHKGLTLEEAAKGLQKHLEESGINGPILLGGISMGGYWTMEFILQFQEKVQSLILISTRPGVDKPEGRENRLKMAERIEKEGVAFLASAMLPGLLGRTTLSEKPRVVDQVVQWIQATNPAAVALAQQAMANRRDQTNLLPGLKIPTLIIAGHEDALIPPFEAETMAQTIPGSQLKVLEQVGHLVPLEDPNRFQKILNDFLA